MTAARKIRVLRQIAAVVCRHCAGRTGFSTAALPPAVPGYDKWHHYGGAGIADCQANSIQEMIRLLEV